MASKKSSFLPKKSAIGSGRSPRTPALGHVRSLEEMYRNPPPAAGKWQGKPKTPTFKKP